MSTPRVRLVRMDRALNQIRGFRQQRPNARTAGDLAQTIVESLRKMGSSETRVSAALRELLGPSHSDQVVMMRMRSGTMELRATHPTSRFTAERIIRPGGTVAEILRQQGVSRVRWVQ